jgi:adenylate kinase
MQRQWGIAVTSVGEVLRQEANAGTPLGKEAATFTNAGKLVPDRLALASIAGWLDAHTDAFVFDGVPRTVGQAEALEKILADRRAPLTAVLWLEVPVEVIEDRVSRRLVCSACGQTFSLGWQVKERGAPCPVCGGTLQNRHDDDPETLQRRLAQYREYTEPLLGFYEQRGLLRRIDAKQEPEQVFAQIEAALAKAASRREVAA